MNKKNKENIKGVVLILLLCVISIIQIISFVSAVNECGNENSYLGTIKIGDIVTLKNPCDDCTYVNLTSITEPDTNLILNNTEMIKSGTEFFINSTTASQKLGCYSYCTIGDKGGVLKKECIDYRVTPSGISQSTSQGLGSIAYLFLMIILMFVFGFLGFKLSKSKTLWVLGIFFIFLSTLFLVYNTWLGYEYHRNFTGMTDSSTPETIFYIFMLILVLGLLVSLALLFLNWKKVFKYIKQEIKRKDDKDDKEVEDWDYDNGAFNVK